MTNANPLFKILLLNLLLLLTQQTLSAQSKLPMLIGKWRLEKLEYVDSSSYHDPSQEQNAQQTIVTFYEDGTFESHKTENNKQTLVDEGTFVLSDDNTYFSQDDVSVKVITLTDSIFIFQLKNEVIFHLAKIKSQQANSIGYAGTVVQMDSKKIIPYATAKLVKQNSGTTADNKGQFVLPAATNPNDTLEISAIEYNTLLIATADLPSTMQFQLTKKDQQLENVTVRNDAEKLSTTLNEFPDCSNEYYGTANPRYQLAQHFRAPVEQTVLTRLHLCKMSYKTIFRLRVYDVDPVHGCPGNDIADTIITIKSRKQQVTVNLRPYNIQIPTKEFYLAIEWIDSSYNYHEEKVRNSQDKHVFYTPSIGGATNKFPPVVPGIPEVWYKTNKNWWPLGKVSRLLLSVDLEF